MLLKPIAEYDRIIFVHGVSQTPVDVDKLERATANALGVPREKVKVYEYEHLLEESLFTKSVNFAAKLGAVAIALKTGINPEMFMHDASDKAADVWLVANPFFKRTRELVVGGLRKLLMEMNNQLLIGFSNGSVVSRLAVEGLAQVPDFLTVGSPLHLKVYEKCLQVVPNGTFPNWVNLYSKWRDPVGYARIPALLGCSEKNQFLVQSPHSSEIYLRKFIELQENI